VFLQIKSLFEKLCDEGYSPSSPWEWDDQGLSGLGEGLRCWLSGLGVSRRIVPSYKDRFVIFTTFTPLSYNHLRLCGQSLNPNSCGPTPGLRTLGSTGRIRRGKVLSGLDMVVA
jgi:hypothetical protein